MKISTRCFSLFALLCISLSHANATEAHWSYQGDHGPAHWGEFSNGLCAAGTQQSPINVEMKKVRPLKGNASDLKVDYGVTALGVSNNGHTIQAYVNEGETVIFKGSQYRLVQFHFHTPSEHLINYRPYPMEMHLVNQDKDGRLLVLAVMIKEGKKNEELAALWEQLPVTQGKEVILDAKTAPNLSMLVPAIGHHLFYQGSLTTPPCTEGVQWVLFEQPIELSKSQVQKFQQLFPENRRPTQPANEREVIED